MTRRYRLSAKSRAALSERMKAQHNDPAFKAKLRAVHDSNEFRVAARDRLRALWATPDYRAAMTAMCAAPEHQERMRAARSARKFLTGLSPEQRKVYRKLRKCGVDREQAVAAASV